jgi:hypothetical protein
MAIRDNPDHPLHPRRTFDCGANPVGSLRERRECTAAYLTIASMEPDETG